jgi:acyl-CoA hydrolase
MPGPLASRNVDDSRVTMTEIVMPEDTNHHGNIFGGRVLALIDKASAVAAMRHCHAPVVTAVDRPRRLPRRRARGKHPHPRGEAQRRVPHLRGGRSDRHAEDPISGARQLTCRAFVTLVAVDGSRRPMAVPPLQARNEEEAAVAREAAERRERRKKHG